MCGASYSNLFVFRMKSQKRSHEKSYLLQPGVYNQENSTVTINYYFCEFLNKSYLK